MEIGSKLRTLRLTSFVVTGFAVLLALAGVTQLALGGIAVKEEYERIEER